MTVGYHLVKDWKGVNLTDDPKFIADNELAWAQNSFPNASGHPGPRLRQCIIGTFYTPSAAPESGLDAGAETTLYEFVDSDGKQRYVAWDPFSTSFIVLSTRLGNQKYIERPDSTSTLVPRALGYPQRPGSIVYNNKLFLFPGHTWPGLIIGADDMNRGDVSAGNAKFQSLGTTWASFTGTTSEQLKFSFGDVYRDVFCLGGLGPPYESLLFFTQGIDSSGDEQESFYSLLSAAKAAAFGFGDGDKLIGFKSTPVTGGASAIEPYGIAFKRRSVWMLQGDVPTVTDDGTCVVTPVMRGEGLISSHAVVTTPYGIIWCSGRNVWLLPPGQTPIPLGDKIKGYLSQLPQTDNAQWYLAYCNDTLYLNCPSPRAGTAGETTLGAALAFLPTEQWWCDLRKLDEPKWWGPMDVKASHMIQLSNGQGALVMGGVSSYTTAGNGAQVAFELGESNIQNASSPTDYGNDLYDVGIVAGDSGANPSTHQVIRTKEFDFGDPMLQKILECVEVNSKWSPGMGYGTGTTPWYVNAVADGGADSSKGNNEIQTARGIADPTSASAVAPSQPGFALDYNVIDADDVVGGSVPLFDRYVAVPTFPRNSTRFLFRTLQFEMYSALDAPSSPTLPTDYIRRKFWLHSFGFRIRPIGRRPGGTIT